uniref:Protein RFT1 homolog n=1 Tax=Aegilops tauschii subsp. strangulata TaxID=200361 RepID=A0A453G400_AEGTS
KFVITDGIPTLFFELLKRNDASGRSHTAYALQLPLFINCVLFLSREGFRRACLRNNSGSS